MSANMQRRIKTIEQNLKPEFKNRDDIILQADIERRIATLSPEEHKRLAEYRSRPVDQKLEKTFEEILEKRRKNKELSN